MRVVLDTNILISTLLFKGQLGIIETLIKTGRITPCFIISTWQEFQNVLRYPKLDLALGSLGISPEQIIEAVAAKSLIFADPNNIPSVLKDFVDNFILAAGVVSQAACIITGDKLLLALKSFAGTQIISPRQFLNKLRYD